MKPNDQITLVENLVATSQRVEEVKQASDEQVVRRKFPDAIDWKWVEQDYFGDWTLIYENNYDPSPVIGEGDGSKDAWANAVQRMGVPPVDIILVLGNWYYLDTGYRVDGSVMSYVKTEGK